MIAKIKIFVYKKIATSLTKQFQFFW